MEVSIQLCATTARLPTVSVPPAAVSPKFAPVKVTEVPCGPVLGAMPLMTGTTVNRALLLASPLTVAMNDVAPAAMFVGMATVMALSDQLSVGIITPPSRSTFVPWVTPNR